MSAIGELYSAPVNDDCHNHVGTRSNAYKYQVKMHIYRTTRPVRVHVNGARICKHQ